MEQFKELGEAIEKKWRDKNYAEDDLPQIASDALNEANLPEKVSAWEVLEWALKQTQLPEQRDLQGNFGDPPITIYNSPRFHIDVYFWLHGTTAIHQHAFCGAFQVLLGSSIHSWYEFDVQEKINAFTEIGQINLKLCELLETGAVQKILSGRQYIHGLFHLDQPSATIVVRSHKSPLHLPQFSYHKPFLAIDPFFEEANAIKKIQCLSTLFRSKHLETDRLIGELLEASDFQTSYSILSSVKAFLQQDQLDQIFKMDASKARFDEFLNIVREKHGERAEIFPKVFAHQDKVDEILKRRSFITEPEHRFFLALLMNVEGKAMILNLIKERFPQQDPVDKILDWSLDLADTRVLGLNIPNALGISDFGDMDLFILECFLNGKSDEEMSEAFRAAYPNEGVEKLNERSENIRRAVIFQPLLH
jgi:hypothetical protein